MRWRVAGSVASMAVCALVTAGCSFHPSSDRPSGSASSVTVVRWPRYWATEDRAETAHTTAIGTRFFAGYDKNTIAYTGQDVVRFLSRRTGKVIKTRTGRGSSTTCSTPAQARIQDQTLVFASVPEQAALGGCNTVYALSTRGKTRWSRSLADGRSVSISQRHGATLLVFDAASGGTVTVVNTRTGHKRWEVTGSRLAFGRQPTRPPEDCRLVGGLSRTGDVVIALASCLSSNHRPQLHGLDLRTGKELWSVPYWGEGNGGANPHPADARLWLGENGQPPAWVDASTGKVHVLPAVNLRAYGANGDPVGVGDMGDVPGAAARVLTNGREAIYALDTHTKSQAGIVLLAVETTTGRRLWSWKQHQPWGSPDIGYDGYRSLGLTPDGSELWLEVGSQVQRFDVATGKVVGIGKPSPAIEIPLLSVIGPDFLLTRTDPGILEHTSGVTYYRTK